MAIAVRAHAAPGTDRDAIAMAVRFADALTGHRDAGDSAGNRNEDNEDNEDNEESDGEDDDDGEDASEDDDRDRDGDDENRADDDRARRVSIQDDAHEPLAVDGVGSSLDGHVASASGPDADATAAGVANADEVGVMGASAGGAEGYEASLRTRGARWWGQLDLGVAWRMRISAPLRALSYRFDELWVVATWRR